MRCYRKMLRISCKDHITNEEVSVKIQQAIGPHEDLLIILERRKLKWYGHVSRSSGLAKTILQGTVKGGRRQGRQRKRWEDNISERIGLEFTKSLRAVENREKWRKLVVKSSVVPQWPPWLRNRWRWTKEMDHLSAVAKTKQKTNKGTKNKTKRKWCFSHVQIVWFV